MRVVNVPAEHCSSCEKPITDTTWREAGCGCCWHTACWDAIPPRPPKPIGGFVSDAGGGRVEIIVDRDTESYPRLGQHVTLVASTDDEPNDTLHTVWRTLDEGRSLRDVTR